MTLFMIEKGLTLWQVGFAFGTFGITAVLMELPLGAMADLHGRIRVYRWSLFVHLVALFIAISFSTFIWILLGMSLMGLSRALESGSVSAWEIEQIRLNGLADKTAQLMGQFQATNALGIAAGALLGGYLPEIMAGLTSLNTPTTHNLIMVFILTIIHIVLLPWLFKEGDVIAQCENRTTFKKQVSVALQHGLKNKAIRPLLFAGFLFGLVLSNLEAYWQPYVKTLTADNQYAIFGWIATGYFICAAIGPGLFSLLVTRLNIRSETMISLIFAAAAPLLYFLGKSSNLLEFAIFYGLFIATLACVNIPVQVLLNDNTQDNIRSTMQSVMSLVLQAGGACAAFGLSPVIQLVGIANVWQGLALALLLLSVNRTFLPILRRAFVRSLFKGAVKRA